MSITITITYSIILEQVKRSLAIIGKRSVDEKGELLFKDITLGSREEGIITDFVSPALVELCTKLDKILIAHTGTTGTSVSLQIETVANWNQALLPALQLAIVQYIVAYCLYSWFVITAPRLSEKYLGDQTRLMASVNVLIHSKQPPTLN